MRFRLRTLLIVLALGPPVLAGVWVAWKQYAALARQRQSHFPPEVERAMLRGEATR